MNSAQTVHEIIDVVVQIRRLDRTIQAKETVVAELTASVDAETGYKRTIANCRLREAHAALSAEVTEYDKLSASIPHPEDLLYGSSVGRIADLHIKRETLNNEAETQRQLLNTEEEKLKSGPWRRKGAPPPPIILAIQLRIAEVDASLVRLAADLLDLMKPIVHEEKLQAEKRDFAAWMSDESGSVPPPACVIERERAAREDILANATRLEILTPAVIARRAAESKSAAERRASQEAAAAAEAAAAEAAAARRASRPKKQSIFEKLVQKYKSRSTIISAPIPELVIHG